MVLHWSRMSALTPVKLRQQLSRLAEGDFADRGANVLAFGLPGTGKTHAMCAIGHRPVRSGRSVLFVLAYRLVQDMLSAKRLLELPRMLRKLDNFDLLIIDDLGYLTQGAEESEVLFTLIAERYERRSLGITSNLVFSEWEKVFANPMATAAAIDRIVHHSVILEFDLPSYRTNEAQERQLQTTNTPTNDNYTGLRAARIIDVDHGVMILPVTSTTSRASSLDMSVSSATTLPSRKATSDTPRRLCEGSITSPFFSRRSYILVIRAILHGFDSTPTLESRNTVVQCISSGISVSLHNFTSQGSISVPDTTTMGQGVWPNALSQPQLPQSPL